MKRVIAAAALTVATSGGAVGLASHTATAASCTHTAAYGNVNIRATKSTSAPVVAVLVGSTSIAGDCGASSGGSYS
jgi:hypothetical protein